MEDMFIKNRYQKSALFYLLYTALFCTIIALFTTFIHNKRFLDSFIISQCIGLSACSCNLLGFYALRPRSRGTKLILTILANFTGIVIGSLLGFTFAGIHLSVLSGGGYLHVLVIGILFASVITYFFESREAISSKEALIREERIRRLDIEKKSAETNLRLLQAQIEPHFLFNTLSNILSLLDTDLEKGRHMLKDLIRYLRATLTRTRGDRTTLGEEMEMIRAYLNIFKIRMGERLSYRIDIPDRIKDSPFQPMLIQPLVENAIRHGLEPEIQGGEIRVRGEVKGDTLTLEVMDTGAGLYENSNPGMSIDNIRGRLKSLYGERGRLILEGNQPSGLRAIIEVPYEAD